MKSLWDHSNLHWAGFDLGPGYKFRPHYGAISIGWRVAPPGNPARTFAED